MEELKSLYVERELEVKNLTEYQTESVSWLWTNCIPIGEITLVEGEGGVGKSTIVADIVSKLSVGNSLPNMA